jgi:hypothetical protein
MEMLVNTITPSANASDIDQFPDYTAPAKYGPYYHPAVYHPKSVVVGDKIYTAERYEDTNTKAGLYLSRFDKTTLQRDAWPVPVIDKFVYYCASGDPSHYAELSYSRLFPATQDNHWLGTVGYLESTGEFILELSRHSDIVANSPASGDYTFGSNMHHRLSLNVASGDVREFVEPDGDIDYTLDYASGTYNTQATSYLASNTVDGVDALFTGMRVRDTANGYTVLKKILPTSGYQVMKLTQYNSASTVQATWPTDVVDLGDQNLLYVYLPRKDGYAGYFGLHGFVCEDPEDNFTNGAYWYNPITGVNVSGVLPVDTDYDDNLLHPVNSTTAATRDSLRGMCLSNRAGDVLFMYSNCYNDFDGDGDARLVDDIILQRYLGYSTTTHKFTTDLGTTRILPKLKTQLNASDVFSEDPMVIQWASDSCTDVFLFMHTADGEELEAGTDYVVYANRFGKRILGWYCPNIWTDPDNWVYLGAVYDCNVEGGLSAQVVRFGSSSRGGNIVNVLVVSKVYSSVWAAIFPVYKTVTIPVLVPTTTQSITYVRPGSIDQPHQADVHAASVIRSDVPITGFDRYGKPLPNNRAVPTATSLGTQSLTQTYLVGGKRVSKSS